MNTKRVGMVAAVLLMVVACKEPGGAGPGAPPAAGFDVGEFGLITLGAGEYDELLILKREDTIGFRRIRQVDPIASTRLRDDSLSPGFFFDDGGDGDSRTAAAEEYDLQAAARDQAPGCGGMLTRVEQRTVVVPLAHTEVSGHVVGDLASIEVRQEFQNPFDVPIEAVYVFPLPHSAAISDFLMTIGDRTIRGVVREREEATRLYEAARAQGITASLLTQERPNIFTQKVANIAPGAGIDVSIEYFHVLPYRDGWYELVFPMVVGPRYNPPGSTDGIGAVTRASRGSSGQTVEVPYLRTTERSGHDISLTLEIDAGVPLEGLECGTHVVELERPSAERARVKLAAFDSLPNRDFVLRYKVAGSSVRTSMHTYSRDGEGWFRMTVLPPAELASLPSRSLEMIFVVDCSGSMSGPPLEQAKLAIKEALKQLRPGDSFEVIRFSNQASGLARSPLPASAENVRHGLRFVNSLTANGGTQMIRGIRAALRHPGDPERLRVVTFLTDGYIGNEEEILSEVQRSIGSTRIFSLGIGSSPNRFLLATMAREGRGAAAFLDLDQDPAKVVNAVYERVRHPALSELEVDWGELRVADVYPTDLSDLFVGRPVELTGRLLELPRQGADPGVRVLGRLDGAWQALPVALTDPRGADSSGTQALAKLWARSRIADLTSQARGRGDHPTTWYAKAILDVALEHGLLSSQTAFLAVDSLTRSDGAEPVTVSVPVTVPAGVSFDTTVIDR